MTRTPLSPAPLVYAHRGDRSRAADNTIEAFLLAVEAGSDGIELDVRSTADDVLIMAHDPSMGDLPPFHEMSFEELREREPTVPTFAETLAAVPNDVFLNVEIKNTPGDPAFDPDRAVADRALQLVREIDDPSRILVSSFDPESVAMAGERHPDVLRGLLISTSIPIEVGIDVAEKLGVQALHPSMPGLGDDPGATLGAIRAAGLASVVWNANTPDEVGVVVAAGVDIVITDDPAMARSVIDHR